MLIQITLGVTWLLISAAVAHYKFTKPSNADIRRELLRIAEPLPHWVLAIAIAIVLPFAPAIALYGWLERLWSKAA